MNTTSVNTCSTFLLVVLLCISAMLPLTTAKGFPMNTSSYLNFHIPHTLRRNESYPHRSAMFGSHYALWGDAGSLVLPIKLAQGDLALCAPPTANEIKSWNLPKDSAYILVGHRGGGCSFVKKVRTAQQIGAAAVLIADPSNNHLPKTMANDGCT